MHPVAEALVAHFERARCRPVVVASHPRSGTHLLIDSLRLNFPECRSWKWWGENHNRLYLHLDELARLTPAEAVARASRAKRPILKTHSLADFSAACLRPGPCPYEPELVAWLRANAAGFLYVYRDGRDVMKSLHAFIRDDDAVAADGTRVRAGTGTGAGAGTDGGGRAGGESLGAFMRQHEHGQSRPALWACHVAGWVADAAVHCVAMETLLRRPDVAMSGIAERFGFQPTRAASMTRADWRLPPKPGTLLASRLARLFTHRPASTAIGPGLTVTRPWESLLAHDDRRFFRDAVGDLLVKLGYEESDDWTDPANDGQPKYPAGFWTGPAARAGAAATAPGRPHPWRAGISAAAAPVPDRFGMQR